MSQFKKTDLSQSYFWTVSRDSFVFQGDPGNTTFHRKQGWEVLYIANRFYSLYPEANNYSLFQFEQVISSKLPLGVNTQSDVFTWISGYFSCLKEAIVK